jgi:hypothetical protein
MHNAFAMRGIQRFGDLRRQADGLIDIHPSLKRAPIDIFEHQEILPYVVDLADVRMIQRGNGARFLLEPGAMPALQPFHRDHAIEASIARLPHLAHAAGADRRK